MCKDALENGSTFQDLFLVDGTFEAAVKYSRGLQLAAQALAPEPPRQAELRTEVLYGPSGTGKTQAAYLRDPELFPLAIPNQHSGALWFDGYAGERTLLIDEYQGWIGFPLLKKLLDPWYPQKMLPVKGSSSRNRLQHILICSNHHPFQWHHHQTIGHLQELTRRIHRAWKCSADKFELVNLEQLRQQLEAQFGRDNEVPFTFNFDI